MRHENNRKLYEYWNSLRGERPAPERSEVEPAEIRALLGDTFILEVSTRLRTISFRLAGTRLCSAYGRELRGLGFLALWSEEDNFDIARQVSHVYRDSMPVVLGYTAQSETNRFLEFEALLLPLMPAADGNARILGIATPKTRPFWLGAEPLVCNHLRNGRQISVETAALPIEATPAPAAIGAKRFGHLVVFEGGKS